MVLAKRLITHAASVTYIGWDYLCFPQRVLAALTAASRRSSGVMVSNPRLPPIRPPFLPIADITQEISERDILGGLDSRSSVPVERRTIWQAASFTPLVLGIRFGMGHTVAWSWAKI
jgi:hypothetical protein